jgi:hypothetical protein
MAAGSDLTSQAIAPGSLPYGDRGPLEQGLSAAMAGGGAPAGGSTAGAPAMGPAVPPEGALGSLLSGAVKPSGVPLTDGLSVGPGSSPVDSGALLGDRATKLRAIATQASSPLLRKMAIDELRRMARGIV